jgi:RNA polymerase sigma factor (sigma-70 family)
MTHFARLIDRIRAGDPSAKNDLIRDAYWHLYRRAHHILRGKYPKAGLHLETGDLLSVSLEKFARVLHEGFARLPENPVELFGYADKVIRRTAIDEVRRYAGRQYRTQFPGARVPADQTSSGQSLANGVLSRLAYEEMIETLSEDEQRLLGFRYIQAMTDHEIAGLVGCDPSTVPRRIDRILFKLRRQLSPRGEGEGEGEKL